MAFAFASIGSSSCIPVKSSFSFKLFYPSAATKLVPFALSGNRQVACWLANPTLDFTELACVLYNTTSKSTGATLPFKALTASPLVLDATPAL